MIKTVKDIDIDNKKVIIRCDFNVPIKDGVIVDDNRIVASLETINYVLSKNAKVILLSHLGRIKEKEDLLKNNLEPVSKRLSELLNRNVVFVPYTRGEQVEEAVRRMKNGDVILLQNTRYEDLDDKKESSNDSELAKYWASLADVFINDAFGTIHRAHASNVGIASFLECGVGFLVEKEINALKILDNPERKYAVILGGAKVSDKIGVIDNLVTKADYILIGGAMAFTFLKAKGYNIGKSLLDEERINYCKEILEKYSDKIILPLDVITSKIPNDSTLAIEKRVEEIDDDDIGYDIGSSTVSLFKDILKTAKTVVWNGPLGLYEIPRYRQSTMDILSFLAISDSKTIIGGGDTAAAVSDNNELKKKIYHVSTGGGATLEYLEGKTLPGLRVLDK
ncbi:MAG: phosphoglycerate kinase [Bacilli bacterium]|nr:phosphoglycerate kinase [Bacilli bacterium]